MKLEAMLIVLWKICSNFKEIKQIHALIWNQFMANNDKNLNPKNLISK